MNSLRRASGVVVRIRSIVTVPSRKVAQDAVRTTGLGIGFNRARPKISPAKVEDNGSVIKSMITSERRNTFMHGITKTMDFCTAPGQKVNMLSNNSKLEKIFASFDLNSIQIDFVGLMGEFAIWAITDLSTGEIQYVVDDSWGSEILDPKIEPQLQGSKFSVRTG